MVNTYFSLFRRNFSKMWAIGREDWPLISGKYRTLKEEEKLTEKFPHWNVDFTPCAPIITPWYSTPFRRNSTNKHSNINLTAQTVILLKSGKIFAGGGTVRRWTWEVFTGIGLGLYREAGSGFFVEDLRYCRSRYEGILEAMKLPMRKYSKGQCEDVLSRFH